LFSPTTLFLAASIRLGPTGDPPRLAALKRCRRLVPLFFFFLDLAAPYDLLEMTAAIPPLLVIYPKTTMVNLSSFYLFFFYGLRKVICFLPVPFFITPAHDFLPFAPCRSAGKLHWAEHPSLSVDVEYKRLSHTAADDCLNLVSFLICHITMSSSLPFFHVQVISFPVRRN